VTITVAVDAMGGDRGPGVTVPATLAALELEPELNVLLVGRRDDIQLHLGQTAPDLRDRLRVHHADEVVEMHEHPAHALRNKKDSSMRVAINLVKEGEADACVSAGNTGALMATARFVLKTLPGIERPAIVGALPAMRGHTHMLDLGANVDSTAHMLVQFAIMGSILVKYVEGVERPTVGLLNIGVEDIKGNETIKSAGEMLKRGQLNYVGFVEADAIYLGDVDLIVCDGFDGNVAIKASEGLAQMIRHLLREEFTRNWARRLGGLAAMPALNGMRSRIDHRRYNGATLVGLNKTVIKSHGGADAFGFRHAIHTAVKEVNLGVPEHIRGELAGLEAA
jgi:glycerol-3-phosphate acyltransferase PlsX